VGRGLFELVSDATLSMGYTVTVLITTSSSPESDWVPVGDSRDCDEVLTVGKTMDTPVPVGAVRN
jgi:hypothetical protein